MSTQNRFSVDWLYILVVIFFMVLIVQAALFTESNKMANAVKVYYSDHGL
jgi:hypothetical protein